MVYQNLERVSYDENKSDVAENRENDVNMDANNDGNAHVNAVRTLQQTRFQNFSK